MELTTIEMLGVTVIEVHGKVVGDVENCHKLHGLIQSLLNDRKTRFVLDLRDAPWINSLGIGMLIGAYTSVKKRDGELVLASPSNRIRDVLTVTHLFTVFEVFDTEYMAVRHLALKAGDDRPLVGESAARKPAPGSPGGSTRSATDNA